MLKVLIADRHTLIRKGLIEILRDASVAAKVGEASTGQETLQMCRDHAWDVVILDVGLRNSNALDTLKALHAAYPALPIIMHGLAANPLLARRCLALGAAGYALKSSDPVELICAIEAALSHRIHISQNITPLSAGVVTLTLRNGTHDR
jgi:two-component system, NarL family, invasion response regulator UvrY